MANWLASRLLDTIDWFVDHYYAIKVGAVARQLGRPRVGDGDGPGFIIIQIDGLSHEHLKQALMARTMPHVRQLLESERMKLAAWHCGLPTTTPAVQAGMLFGNRFDIPGFRWYEKDRQRSMLAKLPSHMRRVRARVSAGREGLLQGGSCYVSVFDGDADLALFTLSSLHTQRLFESMRGIGVLLAFLLNPIRSLRLLMLIIGSYLASLWGRLYALIRPSVLHPLDVLTPLAQAVGHTLFNEVQTFGVMVDIYRGVPAIYANYTAYDEAAHQRGPDHRTAFRALRRIDRYIRQIDQMATHYRRQSYDLYILSDHGNSRSVPFSWRLGRSLGDAINEQVKEDLEVDETITGRGHGHATRQMRFLLDEVKSFEERLSPRLRSVLGLARLRVKRRLLAGRLLDYDLARQRDIIVRASGPLAHVYFNASPDPMELDEIVLLYPTLLDGLTETPGIGLIAARAGQRTLALSSAGSALLADDGVVAVEGDNPLAYLGDTTTASREIHQLAHYPHAGDLIILGAMDEKECIVTFEDQVATHGGLGGPQERPFILWPGDQTLEPATWRDAEAMYRAFRSRYGEQ